MTVLGQRQAEDSFARLSSDALTLTSPYSLCADMFDSLGMRM